jgi:hypothetical protein
VPLRIVTGWEHGPVTPTSAAKGPAGFQLATSVSATGTTVETGGAGARTGSYFLRHVAAATQQQWNYGSALLGTNQTWIHSAFAFRYPTGGFPGGDAKIFRVDGSGDANPALFRRNSDSRLVMAHTLISQAPVVGPVIVENQWYWIEMLCQIGADPCLVDWWVDGVQQGQSSFDVAAGGVIANVNVGGDTTWTGTLDFDDLLIWTDTANPGVAPVGRHHIEGMTVLTAGTTTEIGTANATGRMVTNSAIDATHNSANILAALAERPPTTGGTASGVGQRTSGAGNAVSIPMTDIPAPSVLKVLDRVTGGRVLVCAWANNATAAANQLGVRGFNAFAETTLFTAAAYSGDNTANPAWICAMYAAGAEGSWGFSARFLLSAMLVRVGYSADINPLPGAHAIYAEVALSERGNPRAQRYRRQVRAPSRNPHGGAFLAA